MREGVPSLGGWADSVRVPVSQKTSRPNQIKQEGDTHRDRGEHPRYGDRYYRLHIPFSMLDFCPGESVHVQTCAVVNLFEFSADRCSRHLFRLWNEKVRHFRIFSGDWSMIQSGVGLTKTRTRPRCTRASRAGRRVRRHSPSCLVRAAHQSPMLPSC